MRVGTLLVMCALLATALAGCTSSESAAPATTQVPAGPRESVAITWSPDTPEVGDNVLFAAQIRIASSDRVLSSTWTVGGISYDETPSVRFDEPGDYDVTLAVETEKAGTLNAEATVTITGEPAPKPTSTGGPEPTATGAPKPQPKPQPTTTEGAAPADPFEPHVIVAVTDSGINPYHQSYYRPERTEHPCTYIRDFPCDIPALKLSVGKGTDYNALFQADKALWESVQVGDWFWIPQTVFVAVHCDGKYASSGYCILDDTDMHGTGTTSSVISENPDALIAFSETDLSGDYVSMYAKRGIPVDIYSISIGYTVPLPLPGDCVTDPIGGLYVHSAGNEPGVSTLLDCWAGNPELIQVGGASAQRDGQEVLAYKEMDVVSYFCRPTAQTKSVDGTRESYCGTSFAAPTVAGALSKVVLQIRRDADYDGNLKGNVFEPSTGLTVGKLRDAMNLTASYDPTPKYQNGCAILGLCIPKNPVAPYLQWGWGFYDSIVADQTIHYLRGNEVPAKSADAVTYMETIYLARQVLYG